MGMVFRYSTLKTEIYSRVTLIDVKDYLAGWEQDKKNAKIEKLNLIQDVRWHLRP